MVDQPAVEPTEPTEPTGTTVSSKELWRRIRSRTDIDVLEEWQGFGALLLSEQQSRAAALEAKAMSMIGWSAAAFVGCLVPTPQGWWAPLVVTVAVVGATCAAAGAVCGFMALYVRRTEVPSQADWFNEEYSQNLTQVRRFYLTLMRAWHDQDRATNGARGWWLYRGQGFLASAVFFVLVQTALSLFLRVGNLP